MAEADDEAPWDARILREIDAGIDESLVANQLKRTPTERVESMRRVLLVAEDLGPRCGEQMVTDFHRVLEALGAERVRFVLIGGIAMVAHGSTRVTVDLDLCYERSKENVARLASALAPLHPCLRDFPPELPFFWDAQTVRSGLNFTLTTDAGSVDLLGEVPGVGDYTVAARDAVRVELYDREVHVLSLDALERAKRAAGRAKDLMDLAEIAVIRRKGGG